VPVRLGYVLGDVANFVDLTALHKSGVAGVIADRRPDGFAAVDNV
jgi:hypothetical protein